MLYPKLPRRRPLHARPIPRGKLRAEVLIRDHGCVLRLRDPRHVCIGRNGAPKIDSDFSLEHVPTVHGPTDVRRDDLAHCVGLCIGTNVKPPSAAEREIMRARLRELFPECTATS